jgi:hypothetical protein
MPRPVTTRVASLVLVAVSLGTLAGCSNPFGSNQAPQQAAQDRAGRLLKAGEVTAALPSVATLPPGWRHSRNILRPTPTTRDKVTPARCRPLDDGLVAAYFQGRTRGYRTYVNPQHAALGVGIASVPDAPPAFGPVRSALRTCTSFRIASAKGVDQVTAQPLSLPVLADHESLTVRYTVHTGGTTTTYDVVRIRLGHNEILADLITPVGKPNTRPLVTVARNALLNLS